MSEIRLPYGNGVLPVDVPDDRLGEIVSPRPLVASSEPDALIRTALDEPIGTLRLEELARRHRQVSILVDDVTRETPAHQILPHLLERLKSAGIKREAIKIVIALGTHRPMTTIEIEAKIGRTIAREIEVVNVSCWDESQFVFLGSSSNGIPAWVNRAVAEADLRIGLGMIVPHSDAGFGGGAKIVLPGVCSGKTVDVFHARCAANTTNLLGVTEGPIRLDLEQFVSERVPLDFICNVVLTREAQLYRCVAGHPIQAHRAGVSAAQTVYGVPVARRYPLVISNSYPADIDLWQSSKGLWGGESVVSTGGSLILVTPCPEGTNLHPLYADYMNRDPDEMQKELDAGRIADPNACAGAIQIGRMKRRIRFGLVSHGLTSADAARMGFAYFDSVEAAIRAECEPSGQDSALAVLTHGGITLPLLSVT